MGTTSIWDRLWPWLRHPISTAVCVIAFGYAHRHGLGIVPMERFTHLQQVEPAVVVPRVRDDKTAMMLGLVPDTRTAEERCHRGDSDVGRCIANAGHEPPCVFENQNEHVQRRRREQRLVAAIDSSHADEPEMVDPAVLAAQAAHQRLCDLVFHPEVNDVIACPDDQHMELFRQVVLSVREELSSAFWNEVWS